MQPLPGLNQIYSLVVQEESQRVLSSAMPDLEIHDSNALMANRPGPSYRPRKFDNQYPQKSDQYCDYCHRSRHTRGKCYKLIGYPNERLQKKVRPEAKNSPRPAANVATDGSPSQMQPSTDHLTPVFSPAQYNQIQQMIHQEQDADAIANVAHTSGTSTGIAMSFLSRLKQEQWIVDSGVSNHMASKLDLLSSQNLLSKPGSVHLPNGDTTDITHTGCVSLLKGHQISNVLYVPNFRFNLLSVSKLTKELHCMVAFYPDLYVFQDISTGKVLGIGKKSNGLYLFGVGNSISHSIVPIHNKDNIPVSLSAAQGSFSINVWHNRLGHIPFDAMQKITKF